MIDPRAPGDLGNIEDWRESVDFLASEVRFGDGIAVSAGAVELQRVAGAGSRGGNYEL